MSDVPKHLRCTDCGLGRAIGGHLHTAAECRDNLRARLAAAEAERDEARAKVDGLRSRMHAMDAERAAAREELAVMTERAEEADDKRREWEVRAAESYKAGRASALADVTRCMVEIADVPDDCTDLVVRIADTIAAADRESYAAGRAAGLREAAATAAQEAAYARGEGGGCDCESAILALLGPGEVSGG